MVGKSQNIYSIKLNAQDFKYEAGFTEPSISSHQGYFFQTDKSEAVQFLSSIQPSMLNIKLLELTTSPKVGI
jgi:hypothetical protein